MRAILTNVFTVIYGLNLLCVLLVVFVERKKPQSTVAWVLVMLFLPGLGAVIYFFLGRTYTVGSAVKYFKDTTLYRSYAGNVEQQMRVSEEYRLHSENGDLARCAELINLLLKKTGSVLTPQNEVTLLPSAQEKYERLFADLEQAKETINIEYFIIKDDLVGRKFVELLAKKAGEGVEVRLLYDGFGSILRTRRWMFDPIRKAGGQVRKFYRYRILSLINLNHRDHRKIVVIDGKISYVGGINLGEEYLGRHRRITPWRDTHLRIVGGASAMLQFRFLSDWWLSTREEIDLEDKTIQDKFFPAFEGGGEVGVQIVSSGPDVVDEDIKIGYLKMINMAKERILIQTPYFIPDETILQGLKMAADSGVDVRVMVPAVPDKKFVYHITMSFVKELQEAGIKVYAYHGFLHAKSIVVDDLMASVGTTNFDVRSFALNFEVNTFLYDYGFVSQCAGQFYQDMRDCHEMTQQTFDERSLFERMLQSVCRMLAPLS